MARSASLRTWAADTQSSPWKTPEWEYRHQIYRACSNGSIEETSLDRARRKARDSGWLSSSIWFRRTAARFRPRVNSDVARVSLSLYRSRHKKENRRKAQPPRCQPLTTNLDRIMTS